MSFDTLIRGGRLVDGTGNPWRYADVALSDDRVAAVVAPGQIPDAQAAEVVDATGLVVCPGFIDIQSHSILPLMADGRCISKITQGVTTEIMGESWTPAPCGGQNLDPLGGAIIPAELPGWHEQARGWRRFGDWLEAMVEHGVTPNIGSFLGGGTLRQYGCGMAMRAASADELALMQRVMAEAMEDGAFGIACALIYPPDAYWQTDEIVAICQVIARYRGLYITHIRSEADQLLEALDEALMIGERAGLPVEIYHLKASSPTNWSKMPAAIARITAARAAGQDVTADMYPYAACGTALTAALPPWAEADGQLLANLHDPEARARIRAEVLSPSGDWDAFAAAIGPEAIMPVGFALPEHRPYIGRRMAAIAAERGQHWIDTMLDLLAAEGQPISTIYFDMSEDNLPLQLRQPWITIASDAGGVDPAAADTIGPLHPRAYGTFPRVLGRYVREQGVLPLEDAIRKMTSAVAQRLRLNGRGILQAGAYADVVVFDPATIGDRATFEQPHQLSVGVRDVWVNGVAALRGGAHTGATPGRRVRPG
jgi:N-acyl-D-aspartate/D-glutamate deacylase